ncbi:MAG TPA: thioredoxin family protein [Anaerolineales bacterium]|nr:thioredoxin family protein [Anaerolineales bacterium]
MGCVLAEPIVNGLKTELAGKLVVLKVDIQSQAGKSLSARYAVVGTPTFILFDPAGEELWRQIGTIDAERVRAAVE